MTNSDYIGRSLPRPCMLSFYFDPVYSGSAVQAHSLSRYLRRLGIEPIVVSANLTASPSFELLREVPVFRIPILKAKDRQIWSFSLSLFLFLIKRRKSFDVLHAHGTLQHIVASAAGRLLRKPTILKIAMADSDIAFHRQGRLWGRVNRFFVLKFDRFIATSSQVRQELIAKGVTPDRICTISNGVDIQLFRPPASASDKRAVRRELGLPDTQIVCFVGIIDPRKNIDGVLRIWRSVSQRGSRGHLVLVGPIPEDREGRHGAYYRGLLDFIQQSGLVDQVTFVGRTADVAKYLRSADVFLFPSKQEGMPNVLLEAMSSGLPCVASAIGGVVDLIRHEETGYLLPLEDEEQFASAVGRLLQQPELAAQVGQSARGFVERNLSLEVIAERYSRLYSELLPSPSDRQVE